MLIRTVAVRGMLAGVGLIAALSLTGCIAPGGNVVSPTTLSTNDPSSSPTSTELPAPSDSATPVEKPTPISLPCDSVVDLQTMYDFNPNFGLLTKFTPDSGSLAAKAAANKGTVCRWVNQTSGDTIDISIARPGPAAFAAARSAAESGSAIAGIGDAAYLSESGQTGIIQVFDGPNWITVSSVYITASGDARSLVNSAVAAAQ